MRGMPKATHTTSDDALAALSPGLTPAAVLEAMEDPRVFQQLARGMLYLSMVKMREQLQDPNLPIAQRMEANKQLAKWGMVDAATQPDQAFKGNLLPRIKIVMPHPAAAEPAITIEAEAPALPEPDDGD